MSRDYEAEALWLIPAGRMGTLGEGVRSVRFGLPHGTGAAEP
jgi:hypothetical protein